MCKHQKPETRRYLYRSIFVGRALEICCCHALLFVHIAGSTTTVQNAVPLRHSTSNTNTIARTTCCCSLMNQVGTQKEDQSSHTSLPIPGCCSCRSAAGSRRLHNSTQHIQDAREMEGEVEEDEGGKRGRCAATPPPPINV